jgi:HAD superfamily hydrolase (TIGR01450 family)
MEHTARFLPWFQKNHYHFSGVFFDIDGTIIRQRMPLDGARELLEFIRAIQFPYFFLTNDACHSRQEKSVFLQAAHLPIAPEEIVSSGDALRLFARQYQVEGEKFFIMGNLGNPNYAKLAGLKITREVSELQECRGVIIGETNYDWESTFNAVINYFINHKEGLMIVPNPDYYFIDQQKNVRVAPGGKAYFLCGVLGKCGVIIQPINLGKPHAAIFDYALKAMSQRYNLSALNSSESFLMVGDSLSSDILGANMFGLTSCLVLTGVTSRDTLRQIRKDTQEFPNYQFDRL